MGYRQLLACVVCTIGAKIQRWCGVPAAAGLVMMVGYGIAWGQPFHVRIVQSNHGANGFLTFDDVRVDSVDETSLRQTPNPCYGGWMTCWLGVYQHPHGVNSGRFLYQFTGYKYESKVPVKSLPTMYDVWDAVIDKNELVHSYAQGYGCTELVMVTSTGWYSGGGLLSNCLIPGSGPSRPLPTCEITPTAIDVHLEAQRSIDVPETPVPGVSIRCDKDAAVTLSVGEKERIPLGGTSSAYAVLGWGAGSGRPGRMDVRGRNVAKIPLTVKTEGASGLEAGQWSGSSVIKITYE